MSDLVMVTETLIEEGKSDAGGWNEAQFEILGVCWPPSPGWKTRVVGSQLTEDEAIEFVNLRGCTKKGYVRR